MSVPVKVNHSQVDIDDIDDIDVAELINAAFVIEVEEGLIAQ